MMQLKVISAFTDKYTDVFYPVGTVLTLDDARAKELLGNSLGLVELMGEIKLKKSKKA